MYQMALTSTQYPKVRSRPSTQPLGHVAYILYYVFIFLLLKSRKIEFKLFISKIYSCYQFPRLKNYTNRYIRHVFVFIISNVMVK